MKRTNQAQAFLENLERQQQLTPLKLTENAFPFVTVFREAGARGHHLAASILIEMGHRKDGLLKEWDLFDQETCEQIIRSRDRHQSLKETLTHDFSAKIADQFAGLEGLSAEASREPLREGILSLAARGKIILIGRASACLTRHLPLGVHVRLMAPLKSRIENLMQLMLLTRQEAEQIIQAQDTEKQRQVESRLGQNPSDPLLYDATFNTDLVPIEDIAHYVVEMITRKHKTKTASRRRPAFR